MIAFTDCRVEGQVLTDCKGCQRVVVTGCHVLQAPSDSQETDTFACSKELNESHIFPRQPGREDD